MLQDVRSSNTLIGLKSMLFTFSEGNLSPQIDGEINKKARSLAINPHELDIKGSLQRLQSLSESEKIVEIDKIFANPETSSFMSQGEKDFLKLYYAKNAKPFLAPETHKIVSENAAKRFYIHLA